MQKPVIELRKISHHKRLSEETPAYTAQLWVDGVHFADVSNHGTGGCDDQRPMNGKTDDDLRALNERIKATYPKQVYDFGDGQKGEYETELELLCHLALGRADLEKMIRRDLSKKVMFVNPKDGKLYGVKVLNPGNKGDVATLIKKRHGVARVVNEMTMDEAVAIYEQA